MSTTSVPPRFVPTLTDVVPAVNRAYVAQFDSAPQHNSMAIVGGTSSFNAMAHTARTEDTLVKRVMQQVDVVLERRLREALGRVILEQTVALAPKLRSEIEQVVKDSIAQAVAQEIPGY